MLERGREGVGGGGSGGRGGLLDRYKQPAINPGAYSWESFSNKFQGLDQGNVHP